MVINKQFSCTRLVKGNLGNTLKVFAVVKTTNYYYTSLINYTAMAMQWCSKQGRNVFPGHSFSIDVFFRPLVAIK